MAAILWTLATSAKTFNYQQTPDQLSKKLSQTATFNCRKLFQVAEGVVGIALLALGIVSLLGILPIGPLGSIIFLTAGGLATGDFVVSILLNGALNRDKRLFKNVRTKSKSAYSPEQEMAFYTIKYKVLFVFTRYALITEFITDQPTTVTRNWGIFCQNAG